MVLNIKRRRISNEIEKKIITGMIISEPYLSRIHQIIEVELLNSDYSKIIAKWVLDYWKKYKTNPGPTIQSLFDINKAGLSDAQAENIEYFLSTLSDEYEFGDKLNVDYLMDQTLEFLKSQRLSKLGKDILDNIETGRVDAAEKEIAEFKSFSKKVDGWYNPLDDDVIYDIFNYETEKLFSFHGVLGELIGPFERGWLFGIMGSMKRGKTWWLQETALQALLNGYKVLFISLEMPWRTIAKRLLKRVTSFSDPDKEDAIVVYPVFDCLHNRYGTCNKPYRKNRIRLVDSDGNVPEYSTDLEYRVCDVCRTKDPKEFKSTIWYEYKETKELSIVNVRKYLNGFKYSFPWRNLRIRSYPAFSASITDIKSDLDNIEYTEDFIPDVIITDYADIMIPDRNYDEYRHVLDEIWKMHKNLAEERHCLVVTATQAGAKKSLKKKTLEQDDISEDSRKLAHVDAMMTLNQTTEEKGVGLLRVGVIGHRHKEFFENRLVDVLQQLSIGQVNLDCEWSQKEISE